MIKLNHQICMAIDIIRLFTSLGLSAIETRIYLANLELGPTAVQEIAKKAKISRTAAYDAIESLKNRGLISTFEKGKRKVFAAEEPENAVAHFRESVGKMEQQIETLIRALPEVKLLAGGERPTARFYEGTEAIYAVFNDVARVQPEVLYEVTNTDDVYAFLDKNTLLDARKLVNFEITKLRMIYRGKLRNPRGQAEYVELPEAVSEFHGDIWIYGNRIGLLAFVGKVVSVIVESQALADTIRALFDTVWILSTHKRKGEDILREMGLV